jgi:putative FmdB family regulatory protein
MPVYTYRREDGTTFDYKQSFKEDPLTVCPTTGQPVVRLISSPGIIFKGSGFYVTDNKGALNGAHGTGRKSDNGEKAETPKVESKPAIESAAAD